MNILNISTRSTGGAGIAALRLNEYLNEHGLCSNLLLLYSGKKMSGANIVSIHSYYRFMVHELFCRIKKTIINNNRLVNSDYLIFNMNESIENISIGDLTNNILIAPDVIIMHWVDLFLNAKNIYDLYDKYKVPILWTFMDMSPMTGGCHYAWDCKGYINRCGKCPGLYSDNENDITRKNIEFKANYLESLNIIPVTCSEWTYRQAKESYLFKNKSVYKILLPVNPEIFKPVDKHSVRSMMGLPLDKKIIFFGSTYLTDKRKGMSHLMHALNKYASTLTLEESRNILLLIAGKYCNDLVETMPFEYVYLGLIKSEQDLAAAYQAADLFICPSIDDSGPLMINESIMCGTPVVSFEMGVALDLVHTGSTGYRAALGNSNDLSNGIKFILGLDTLNGVRISAECRKLGLELCHPKVQVEALKNIISMHTTKLEVYS